MSPIQTLRRGASRRVDLVPMTPMEQLRAGSTVRRVSQLLVGLWLYGTAMAMFIRAELGLDPWDVFHYGVQDKVGWSFGTVVIVVGILVLLLWIPLRQWPGLGTIANVFVIVKERGPKVAAAMVAFIFPFAVLVGAGVRVAMRLCGF